MNRKAEVVPLGARTRLHASRPAKATWVRATTDDDEEATNEPMHHQNDNEQPWQLIHDDPFDRARTDAEIDGVVHAIAARSPSPYREVVRLLAGIDDVDEGEAALFFERIVEHRRDLSSALGREVHIRVAALDMMTTHPPRSVARRDSHPIVVTSSMLERALEEATLDGLTGLPQRAQFMNLLRHELRQRRRRSVAVAYIDLDGFKRVNDQQGHAAGDEVLRTLARAARGVLREGDALARLGGDEFAVLLLDVTEDEAEAVVDRLRTRFERLTSAVGTSFSCGIALADVGELPEAVIMRADSAMYREKQQRHARAIG
ncbi:MAG: GGDEF domain-containing protein [Deltaproteobacteria bacterium]|nr:GGDEF domain-containing protein [Deltaproteobacteria bacterium]